MKKAVVTSTLPVELLWALIGLALTITGTFVEASFALPVMDASLGLSEANVQVYALGMTCQIFGVLLSGCMGGSNAGVLSQLAYLTLGMLGFQVFGGGSGVEYYREPAFGYLLGFVPGAWVCGWLAFQASPKIESLTFSGLCGLAVVHIMGIVYLVAGYALGWIARSSSLWDAIFAYSMKPFPGHLAIVCTVGVLSYGLRKLLFY